MVGALNRLLLKHDRNEVDYHGASREVSNGGLALVRHGFGLEISQAKEQLLLKEFLQIYADHICEDSRVYEGMLECLEFCESKSIPWGVITNKPLALARDLLDELNLLKRCKVLLGGDSLPVKKPDPVPLLHSAMLLNLAPSECLYLGDHLRDIQAARSAGMDAGAAAWGYIDANTDVSSWSPDVIFTNPSGLHRYLKERITDTNQGR
jgi:phosphoglycolate phosphatase